MKSILKLIIIFCICGYTNTLFSEQEVTKERIGSLNPDSRIVVDVNFNPIRQQINSLSNDLYKAASDSDDKTERDLIALSNNLAKATNDLRTDTKDDIVSLSNALTQASIDRKDETDQDVDKLSNRVLNLEGLTTTGIVFRALSVGNNDYYQDATGCVWRLLIKYAVYDKNGNKYPLYDELINWKDYYFFTDEFTLNGTNFYYYIQYYSDLNKFDCELILITDEGDEETVGLESINASFDNSDLNFNVSFPDYEIVLKTDPDATGFINIGNVVPFGTRTVVNTQNGLFYIKSALVDDYTQPTINTITNSIGSFAFGQGNKIINSSYSLASGWNNIVSNENFAQAFGYITVASGRGAHAEGWGSIASGEEAHAEGYFTEATNFNAHAEGYKTKAYGQHSHAQNWYTEAHGFHSHAEGDHSIAVGDVSHAAGRYAKATHNSSFVWQGINNGSYYESIADGTFCINPSGGIRGTYIGKKHIRQHIIDVINESDLSETVSNLNTTIQNQQNQINQLLDIISTLSNKLETTITNFDNGRIMIDSETKSVYKREYGYVIRIDPEQVTPHMKMSSGGEESTLYLDTTFTYNNTLIGDGHKSYYYINSASREFKLELEIFSDNKIIFRLHHLTFDGDDITNDDVIYEKPGNIMSDETWTDSLTFVAMEDLIFDFSGLHPYRPVDVIIGRIQP